MSQSFVKIEFFLPISCRVLSVFGLIVAGLSAEAVRHFAVGPAASLALATGLRGCCLSVGGFDDVTVVFLVYVSTEELLLSLLIEDESLRSNLTLVFCEAARPLSLASEASSIFKGTSLSWALFSLLKVDHGGG